MENMFKLIALTLAVSLGAGSVNAAAAALGATTAATRAPLSEADRALRQAAKDGDLAGVVAALDRGADVNAQRNGSTALHSAACHGYTTIVERLLALPKIDVNVRDSDDCTPLYWAVFNGHHDVAERLLNAGADVNAASKIGLTALHIAAFKGHPNVAERLLNAGADVNAADSRGLTALYWATDGRHTAIVALLEEAHAQAARWSPLRSTWVGGLLVAQQALDAEIQLR